MCVTYTSLPRHTKQKLQVPHVFYHDWADYRVWTLCRKRWKHVQKRARLSFRILMFLYWVRWGASRVFGVEVVVTPQFEDCFIYPSSPWRETVHENESLRSQFKILIFFQRLFSWIGFHIDSEKFTTRVRSKKVIGIFSIFLWFSVSSF